MSTALSEATLAIALQAWNLTEPVHLSPIPGGYTSNIWYVDTPGQRVVAKYVYDAQAAFDSGLRAAEVLARVGVVCSAPIRTRSGELSLLVEGPHGRAEPLAVLHFVPGIPLESTDSAAPALIGNFLGHMHTIWHRATDLEPPPDRIFAYIAEEAPEVAAQPGLQTLVQQAIANVRAFEATTPITYGVTIGDYMELLHDPATGHVGLIDTGAVGWGPLLFDVAIMLGGFPPGERIGEQHEQFLSAYLASAPIQPGELAGIRQYAALHWAQLAKYFAWRLAHDVKLGDADLDGNARSFAEIRAALESFL
ncbi:MAG: phosphotransferase [Roseiflexaceae bacterium]